MCFFILFVFRFLPSPIFLYYVFWGGFVFFFTFFLLRFIFVLSSYVPFSFSVSFLLFLVFFSSCSCFRCSYFSFSYPSFVLIFLFYSCSLCFSFAFLLFLFSHSPILLSFFVVIFITLAINKCSLFARLETPTFLFKDHFRSVYVFRLLSFTVSKAEGRQGNFGDLFYALCYSRKLASEGS